MQLFALPTSLLALVFPILLPTIVLADVEFTEPAAGSAVNAAQTIQVKWKESDIAPPITNLGAYTLTLMTGGNEDNNMLPLPVFVSEGNFQAGYEASGTIPTGIAQDVKNGFFFRILTSDYNGTMVINYSDRFSIPNLTGITPPRYLNAATALDGSMKGPNNVGDAAPSSASSSSISTPTSTGIGKAHSRVVTMTETNPAPTATGSPNTPKSSPKSSGISTGALAGIAIAGAAIGILGIGLALWVCLRGRRRRETAAMKLASEDGNDSDDNLRREMSFAPSSQLQTPPAELDPYATIVEAGDGMRPPEMDSMNVRAELEGDSEHSHYWQDEPLTPVPDTPVECLTLDNHGRAVLGMPGTPVQPRYNV
ncbi:Cell wall synthesis protein kre9 precursor [Saxophila tyrrhenica]|uniref:Cell wall synthesis protein kre9 n=1 Tax=Saxophila tyrrhenica TaxID=1690608 RepID=A0AAV9PPQ5_9PEZI|nr:Cell wall synthesis protein kre9 precursor [Saxophila tyrrhenica]